MRSTRNLRAVLGGVSLLVIGAVLGVMVDRFMLLHTPVEAGQPAALQAMATDHAEALADLARTLELSETQTAHVHEVFMRHQGTIDRAWLALRHHMQAVVDTATAEIEVVLDAAQRERLRAWIAERHGTADPTAAPARHRAPH